MGNAVYFGGLPTAIDVRKLEEKYGVPEPGTLIPHVEIAAVIGVKWRTARYTTVVNAWRKKLEAPHNLHTFVEPGKGLRILTADEAVDVRKSDWRKNVRAVKRTVVETKRIDPSQITDPEKLRLRDKMEQVTSRVWMTMAEQSKALAPPKPPDALPRRAASG